MIFPTQPPFLLAIVVVSSSNSENPISHCPTYVCLFYWSSFMQSITHCCQLSAYLASNTIIQTPVSSPFSPCPKKPKCASGHSLHDCAPPHSRLWEHLGCLPIGMPCSPCLVSNTLCWNTPTLRNPSYPTQLQHHLWAITTQPTSFPPHM